MVVDVLYIRSFRPLVFIGGEVIDCFLFSYIVLHIVNELIARFEILFPTSGPEDTCHYVTTSVL